MSGEKLVSATKAWVVLLILLGYAILVTIISVLVTPILFVLLAPVLFVLIGFKVINPNDAVVLVLCGVYKGTVKDNGCFWMNPFTEKRHITTKVINFSTPNIKVNDRSGNPIIIGAIVVCAVQDSYLASFSVENYHEFVRIQSEGALRQVAGRYDYDNLDDGDKEAITLMSGKTELNEELARELSSRLEPAGVHVYEARISDLSYAPEIAAAMLQRQQAAAVISARRKIVEGAVGMVELAFEELRQRHLPDMSQAKKEELVSNLLVVLCSDKAVQPNLPM